VDGPRDELLARALSPVMSTDALVGATFSSSLKMRCMTALRPIIS